jgi:excisionase family DNA binding protein
MSKFITVQTAAKKLGVHPSTLRRWEREGKLIPDRTQGNQREMYCASYGWTFEVISDLGSGMNYAKKGLNQLLTLLLDGGLGRLVLTHKDRLLRFGAELIFALCEKQGVEVVIINQGSEPSFEEELAQDVLEIITVFSARLYGSRSRKNRKMIEGLKESWNASHAQN